ncbi:uncharacterized protein LTR77_007750 [Saxophila tyrrhenica]|uniref:MYND-type domain-containing protein n=1 Tax=Saxophila tyrrhenica TaxID=1690608 RepID=A0AAV9P2Y1_9PEZI|nr:hypothetical protein LTR77_007750 [Saxophila tyrrhenica]
MGAWGYGLFMSDQDADIASDLASEVGLTALEKRDADAAVAEGKKVVLFPDMKSKGNQDEIEFNYALGAGRCSHPDKVREYLDNGPLEEYFTKHKQAMLSGKDGYYGQGYKCLILAACAMTLGCKFRPDIRELIKKTYTRNQLPPGSDEQMEAALVGPPSTLYKSGEPHTFIDGDTKHQQPKEPTAGGFIMMNVPIGGFFGVPKRKDARRWDVKAVVAMDKALAAKGAFGMDRCAGCGCKHGEAGTESALSACGRCKFSRYCGKECQKQHYKLHKEFCKSSTAEEKDVAMGDAENIEKEVDEDGEQEAEKA